MNSMINKEDKQKRKLTFLVNLIVDTNCDSHINKICNEIATEKKPYYGLIVPRWPISGNCSSENLRYFNNRNT